MLTPVEKVGELWLKRDDLWVAAAGRGGKSRTADLLCQHAKMVGVSELCIAVDRNSSVPGMVSRVCKHHGVGLRVWLPAANAALPRVFEEARSNGAVLEEIRPGYMSVRRKRLKDYVAASKGAAVEIDVGLLWGNIGRSETAEQVENVRELVEAGKVERIVVPVGSGGMLRGVADGLPDVPILGVCCGNPPEYGYPRNVTLVKAQHDFGDEVTAKVGDVELDPVYEAKCLDFTMEGDLLWIVAHRDTE